MPQAWVLNGAIYLFRTAGALRSRGAELSYGDRVAAYKMSPPYGLNIDDPEDWAIAERALNAMAASTHQR